MKDKKPPKMICPVCWRYKCRMFLRLMALAIPDITMRSYFANFHRSVCGRCKRSNCNNRPILKRSKGVETRQPCSLTEPKTRPNNTVLPQWWLAPEGEDVKA